MRNCVVSVAIPTWMEVSGVSQTPHVKYAIKVLTLNVGTWTCWKRYKEFFELNDTLKQINSSWDLTPIPFPKKGGLVDVETRRKDLESFLKNAIQVQEYSDVVAHFLGVQDKLKAAEEKERLVNRPTSMRYSADISFEIPASPASFASVGLAEDRSQEKTTFSPVVVLLEVHIISFELWTRHIDDSPFAVRSRFIEDLML
jgi:hypothetical protein